MEKEIEKNRNEICFSTNLEQTKKIKEKLNI